MNDFEKSIINLIGQKAYKRINNTCIGIGGAGGLGSNCAFNLVRSGFNKFIIVDYDIVEFSNLNRQFYFKNQVGKPKVEMLKRNLCAINPHIDVRISKQKIDEHNIQSLFNDCQVIVEAFDKPIFKKLIVETFLNTKKLLVAASGVAGFSDTDNVRIKKVNENFFIVGDFITEANEQNPPLSPKVNIVAAKQADIVLDYVVNTA